MHTGIHSVPGLVTSLGRARLHDWTHMSAEAWGNVSKLQADVDALANVSVHSLRLSQRCYSNTVPSYEKVVRCRTTYYHTCPKGGPLQGRRAFPRGECDPMRCLFQFGSPVPSTRCKSSPDQPNSRIRRSTMGMLSHSSHDFNVSTQSAQDQGTREVMTTFSSGTEFNLR